MPPHQTTIALVVERDALRAAVQNELVDGSTQIRQGRDAVSDAHVVVCEACGEDEIRRTLTSLRTKARPDAAFLVVLPPNATESLIHEAHEAGAFACLQEPLRGAELRGLVASAVRTRSAKIQVADLSRQLDLKTHLASLGMLTGGLAHELGSPLAVVQSALEFVERHLAGRQRETAREAIDDATRALARIVALVRTLQELAHQHRPELVETRLDVLATELHAWAVGQFPAVSFELAIDEAIATNSNATMLRQVLVNLIANAARAASGFGAPRVRLHVYQARGNPVISVRDNGPGIAPADQEKIFDPFYTTHRDTGGTGLGLALCREYAVQIGADLSVWSIPRRGSCFRITFPFNAGSGEHALRPRRPQAP